ncbi:sugar MFS transporter [Daejeonella lutea]|uniref:MFS transporter, FHS family, L-fucose permease n=1 Tax=Daejeonella lutea TaxID=572036 RepID=A0A1T5AMM8_9SPHI|nr:sugar MFS transporter [Daejeonella lutea]SKB36264.1 MFS transporter, FHS family, L-fucose permease [Daejeonella lutea]
MANFSTSTASTAESSNPSQNYLPALISLGVLYFMNGFITCLNDTLVPFFKEGFTLSYADSSLVQFYFFLTYGLMSFPAGIVVEKIGYKNGMVLGFAIAAVGALLFYPAADMHLYYLFLCALFVLAIGIVVLQVASNPYITALGPARTASSRLTLIQAIGSIGTTTAPLFGASFILSRLEESGASSDAVKYPYLGIAAMLVIIALVVFNLKLPKISTTANSIETTAAERRSIFSFRNLNFGSWAIFAYVGAEVSIGTFLTNYISDTLRLPIEEANAFVTYYWGGMLVGRLIGSYLLQRLKPSSILTFCAAAAIALILISVVSTGAIAVWTMIGVGLFNSVMFAIIFALSVEGLGKYTTKASGILSTAIAGGAIVSFSQGYLKDHFSWAIAFMLPVVCYAYIVFFGINGHRQGKK